MQFPRTKLVEKFAELFLSNETQYIAIVGDARVGKSTFLTLLQDAWIFWEKKIESIRINTSLELEWYKLRTKAPDILIIDNEWVTDMSHIRAFIESYSSDSRVIFTSRNSIDDTSVVTFILGGISFREYAEGHGNSIDTPSIMQWSADIVRLNTLRDSYILTGKYPDSINDPDGIPTRFSEKISIMNQELFEKEHGIFLEFIRTLAMDTGNLYKEDGIAKMMNISRRKVRKYTELLMTHSIIHAIWPFVENTTTELSRHVKLYWNDLADYHAALGVTYYHGEGKQGVIENFILLELETRVRDTHDIHFYRKKSGAEVQFILVNKTSKLLSPISITTRSTDAIPQALTSFHDSYHDRIEHSMLLNADRAGQKQSDGVQVIILPHVAI